MEGQEPKTPDQRFAEGLPARPPVLCPGCPHRGIFYALGKHDVVVSGDIGCYSLAAFKPLDRMDIILCMGGGVSMAHGFDKAGDRRKVVGVVGDSTFFHSGITGLVDIVYNRGTSTIIVLDNRTTAMTGHQDHPGTGLTLGGDVTKAISIQDIGRACGVERVVTINPYHLEETERAISEELAAEEPSLIISLAPCPLRERREVGPGRTIDPELCKGCRKCLSLGCPAIELDGEVPRINRFLCAGCGLCQEVCPHHAVFSGEGK